MRITNGIINNNTKSNILVNKEYSDKYNTMVATGQKIRTKTLGLASQQARAFANTDAKAVEGLLRGEAQMLANSVMRAGNRRGF